MVKSIKNDSLDIKNRKLIKENNELKSEKERLRNFIKATNVGTWEWDTTSRNVFFNEKWAEIVGYTLEELSPTTLDTWEEHIHPDDLDLSYDMIDRVFKKELDFYEVEVRLKHKLGHYVWILDRGEVTSWSEDGEPLYMMGTHTEITKIKNLSEQFELERNLLNTTLLSLREGVISIDLKYNVMFLNKSAEHLTGWEQKFSFQKPIEEIVIINDKKRNNIIMDLINKVKIDKTVYNTDESVIMKSKHGLSHTLEISVVPTINNNDEITGFVLVLYDLSEIKMMNDELKIILNSTNEGIYGLDMDENCTFINKKGVELLGYESSLEIIGKNIHELIHHTKADGSRFPKDECHMRNAYKNNEEIKVVEDLLWTKKGSSFPISYSAIPKYKNGNIDGAVVTFRDITESKKHKEDLIYLGYNDALTESYNRRYYEENLKKLDIEENLPLSIIMADINGLKLVNDAFGHSMGDELLINAARIINESIAKECFSARIGGDEFVIVMPKKSMAFAEKVINRINKKAKEILIQSIPLSISFGCKTKKHVKEDIHDIYRSAEDLMYREKLLEIPSMRSGAILTILNTLYEKDQNSELHSRTVSNISEQFAIAYGMDRQDVAEVKTAGLLHDIGKIVIASEIINKDGKLTSKEYDVIKSHPEIGFRILNSSQDMRSISNIVLSHHERWDGRGYPRGIKSDEIPLKSRFISIADAFDAMTSERSYKKIISFDDALKEIIANSGTQFDPELVKVFSDNFEFITKSNKT